MQSEKEFLRGFEECFGQIEDKRQQSKVDHPLLEVLFLCIVAVASKASDWKEIEFFGKTNLDLLRQYYPFLKGTPSDDTIRRVFEALDPKNLNKVLMEYFTPDLQNEHIAIDGKTLKGSSNNGKKALHFLNVYASGCGLTLFGKPIDDKSNEIAAIPEAIDVLDIKGAVVTIDAMGCQKTIAKQIKEKGGDYIFGLKGNHTVLHNQVKDAFGTNAESFFKIEKAETTDKGHGREEKRVCRVIRDFSKIPNTKDWEGIAAVIEIKKTTITKGKLSESTNYYISSSSSSALELMKNIRNHWKVESMHWTMDVVFKEDASSMYKGNVPANMALIRRFVLNILTQMKQDIKQKPSRPLLMYMIGMSNDHLHTFIKKLTNYS
jgi:predicted transposase YbfD/YdcC